MTSAEFLTVARVLKTQGRRGEVACELLTDFPEKFAERKCLFAFDPMRASEPRRELTLESHWLHKGLIVFKFAGVDSITDAESLLGCEIQIPESQRAELEPGAYYISDLVGCQLFNGETLVGTVRGVNPTSGTAPLLLVTGADNVEFDIPFAEPYLVSVDVAGKHITMRLPDGLLDLNS